MKIKGIQKLTLVDYPGKLACTIFLFGCNFRCGFCHNPELVLKERLEGYSKEDILDFLEKRKKYLDGVCISGGEPLLDIDLEFVKKIKAMNYLIKIDTNGSFPEKIQELVNESLVDYISMDVKSSKENYNKISNSSADLNKIEESMRIISELENYEFRTTVLKNHHSKEEIIKILEWINEVIEKKPKRFVLQGFKKREKMINLSFIEEPDTEEEYLLELKKLIEPLAEEVIIRI